MPYIKRDEGGKIAAIFAQPEEQAKEQLAADDPELLAFLHQDDSHSKAYMRQSDVELQRVLEDVIDLLIDKGVLMFTDLPAQAQRKLVGRKRVRQTMQTKSTLFSDEDDQLLL
ncbi:tryptophan synthase subunit beta like protein [Pokkaliibacter sp. CJK22405]|uniref:tryptophan synthase subunit beta like protein n=1 Tax=Pokkaliibacter sp. CJK22405 TaxID=3384615 RepID=UPI0039852335